jgi:hypothetical protein
MADARVAERLRQQGWVESEAKLGWDGGRVLSRSSRDKACGICQDLHFV